MTIRGNTERPDGLLKGHTVIYSLKGHKGRNTRFWSVRAWLGKNTPYANVGASKGLVMMMYNELVNSQSNGN